MDCDDTMYEIIAGPPREWNAIAERLPREKLEELTRRMDGNAIESARRARYFSARSLGLTHEQAVRISNMTTRKLAESLGYAYPKSHDLSF